MEETERVRRIFDEFAPKYDRSIRFWEWALFKGGRQWICAQAIGDVLEIGVGTGRNLPYYAPNVRLTAIDISPEMLHRARERGEELGRRVDLRLADAQALDLPDESFDTVVIGLCLCSIPDDRKAVSEAKRVLRPGGRVVLLEHVRSPLGVVQSIQRLIDPLTVRFQGDHLTRQPLDSLRAEGFEIEKVSRSRWGIVERATARKPSTTNEWENPDWLARPGGVSLGGASIHHGSGGSSDPL